MRSTPEATAENILSREFHTRHFGEKWLTDVTEMKYGVNGKAYLSAILDLADKSIVSFVIGHSNNNALVFETFDIAIKIILMQSRYSIVTGDSDIPQNPSVKSSMRQE